MRDPEKNELYDIEVANLLADLRWKRIKRGILLAFGVIMFLLYLAGAGQNWGFWSLESSKAVAAVVKIEGPIGPGESGGNAELINEGLKKAFENKHSKAVVLYINSPGGAPAEAERITQYLRMQKKQTGKRVLVVCGDMCASAGYMIAIYGDQISAGDYSLVGSIGAMLSSWNAYQALDRLGVQHQSFTSGPLKGFLSPFDPPNAAVASKAQNLVDNMGKIFRAEVEQRRGSKLDKNAELFSGAAWSGEQARKLGLIDHVATLDMVVRKEFGADVEMVETVKPKASLFDLSAEWLGGAVARALAGGGVQIR